MSEGDLYRPRDVGRALLAALDAAEGRKRQRKRDQTPDAIGLAVKRTLLERLVAEDPAPDAFEAWLLAYPESCAAPELVGPARAMARAVFDEWRLAHSSLAFRRWLEDGAPSDDARPAQDVMEPSHVPDAAAIVLAGGRSSRMGQPKALLPFGDRPLVAHLVRMLGDMFREVMVVAAPGQELPALAATVVRDQVEYQGPVGGLSYGLAASTRDVNFVTSCDAAFLEPRVIRHLLTQISHHDVVVPVWEGRLQPLHAVYRRGVLPLLQAQLARAELRVVSLYDNVRTLRVDESVLRRIDPDGWSFFNMNTPEEYERAQARWRQLHPPASTSSDALVQCTVELYGVAQLVGKTSAVTLTIAPPSTIAHVIETLGTMVPALVGTVIEPDRRGLLEGYACNVNGLSFVRDRTTPVRSGDTIIILSADAGG